LDELHKSHFLLRCEIEMNEKCNTIEEEKCEDQIEMECHTVDKNACTTIKEEVSLIMQILNFIQSLLGMFACP
jgi:hypothetical protein